MKFSKRTSIKSLPSISGIFAWRCSKLHSVPAETDLSHAAHIIPPQLTRGSVSSIIMLLMASV